VDRVVVWSDAEAFHGWWRTTGVETTYPKGTGATAFTTSVPLTKGSIALIAPLVFTGSGLVGTLTEVADLEDAGAELVGGRPCRKLVGVARSVYRLTGHESNVRRTAIWIDTGTFLVRKIVEDTPKGSIAGQVNRVTTIFSPHANPSLDDRRFTFTAPEAR
jgi:hypothetical protein